jgi:hypothetical protein
MNPLIRRLLDHTAQRLDRDTLQATLHQPDQRRLSIRQEGEIFLITTQPGGFSPASGARRLALLSAVSALVAVGVLGTVVGVQIRQPERIGWLVWLCAGGFAAMAALSAWLIWGWARAAAYEAVEIQCDHRSLRLRRLAPTPAFIEIPTASIKSVLIAHQFSVSLTLLVLTHDQKVHRLMSGLSKSELDDAAGVLSTFVPLQQTMP